MTVATRRRIAFARAADTACAHCHRSLIGLIPWCVLHGTTAIRCCSQSCAEAYRPEGVSP